MDYVCGGFDIKFGGRFRSYTDLDEYVKGFETTGLLLGEDASYFGSFYGVEVQRCFSGEVFRIGMIFDDNPSGLKLCSIHNSSVLAVGMNNEVDCIDLENRSILHRIKIDSWVHYLLCNGDMLAIVHEMGAKVLRLPDFKEVADVYCEIVGDATLLATELVLVSMEEEITRVDLTAI